MKRFTAFALALALFTVPTVAMAAWDGPALDDIFDRYEETILLDQGS
ncbi:MAG: hypothetical protein ACE5MK_13010 [Acidobacteriota bacterium]